MKRTAIRRKRGPATPVYDSYKNHTDLCDEILRYTGVRWLENGVVHIERTGIVERAHEVHHIFGRGKYGDVWSNLIGVNKAGHYERHHGTKGRQAEFTTLCLMAKWAKHIQLHNLPDWNYCQLRSACGHNIGVIVESVRFADEFLEVGRKQLLKILEDAES